MEVFFVFVGYGCVCFFEVVCEYGIVDIDWLVDVVGSVELCSDSLVVFDYCVMFWFIDGCLECWDVWVVYIWIVGDVDD